MDPGRSPRLIQIWRDSFLDSKAELENILISSPELIVAELVTWLIASVVVVRILGQKCGRRREIFYRLIFGFVLSRAAAFLLSVLHLFHVVIQTFPLCGPGNDSGQAEMIILNSAFMVFCCLGVKRWKTNLVVWIASLLMCGHLSGVYYKVLFEPGKDECPQYTGNVCFIECGNCRGEVEAYSEWHTWLTGLYGLRWLDSVSVEELAELRENHPPVKCALPGFTSPKLQKSPSEL